MFASEPPSHAGSAELADLPLELIEREIESLAARIKAGSARWLELIAEFDRREGWGMTGCRSTAEWVAWRCALTPRAAREHVRVARALPALPVIREAFGDGALSYSKVRALTRVADRESEAELLELARHATAAQLDRMVRAARRVTTAETEEAAEDPDGSAGPLAAPEPSGSAEPPLPPLSPWDSRTRRPAAPTNAESLAALSEAALARPPTGSWDRAAGERYQVLVHVDSSTLATDSPGAAMPGRGGSCAIADGPGIAPETARRLACDCALVALVERDGKPLSVGRRTRSIPPSIRRALLVRDGRCQFPGCERHRFVDAHHIVHWARGGATSLDNLVLLCRHHHRLVHEGGFAVSVDPDARRRFRDPSGADVVPAPTPPSGLTGLSPARARTLTGTGEGANLGYCVDAVLTATGAL